jgi:hypothetical protein
VAGGCSGAGGERPPDRGRDRRRTPAGVPAVRRNQERWVRRAGSGTLAGCFVLAHGFPEVAPLARATSG